MNFVKCLLLPVFINAAVGLNAQGQYTLCASPKGIQYKITDNAGSIYHWTVEGGRIVSDPNADTITVIWSDIPGEYDISVYEESVSGCLGNNMRINVKINASPFVDLGNIRNICLGGQTELNPGEGFDTYLWQDGSSQPTLTANVDGIYWVEVTSQDGCSYRDSVLVIANPPPDIYLGRDTILCAPDELVLDAGYYDGSYSWNSGDIAQSVIAREGDGQIWVRVTDVNGCTGTDTIQILDCISKIKLTIPNAFTPNGDGHNDYWQITGLENYPNLTVKIYDPLGIRVFESDRGFTQPWDGTSNGRKMPVNAYYYVINPGDGSKEIVGSITLIR